ncbi:MAG: zinc ribbon domain-containing protein [Oscillibacter sp.]|nr:zinc ribbon domain-containing protein [Oscillibacter sp.]
MLSILFILAVTIALIVLAIRAFTKTDGPKSDGKEYLVADGVCPTCGSPCKWRVDPETGKRVSFVCTWCGDFK